METPPMRITRDPLLNKSNYISYAANASWHQEILAAADRARKHIDHYLSGLLEVVDPDAKIFIAASGTAVSQSREALKLLEKKGVKAGLIKIKSIRPFPKDELIKITEHAELIVVPEFNAGGWLAREIKSVLDNNSRVISGPRVFGGMTLPPELIAKEIMQRLRGGSEYVE
jgi:pyruvate ferredoxin oxidoreductase alpha subunit